VCGIVGIASNFTSGFSIDEANAFTDMLVIDSLRGLDSTGVFGVDKFSSVRIAKSAQHGLDFVLHEEYKKFRGQLSARGLFAVGHNRAATRGIVNDKNAHPFWVDDKIILVQNGTVRGDHKKLTEGSKEVEVDSEAIAHVLAEEPDIEKALQKIDSAFALVWYNTETETLHLIRNHERPLWYALGKNNGMIWASEETTLNYVIKKHKLDMHDPTELPTMTLISLKIDGSHYKAKFTKIDGHYRYKYEGMQTVIHDYRAGGRGRNSQYFFGEAGEGYDAEANDNTLHPLARTGMPVSYNKSTDVDFDFMGWAMDNLPDFHVSGDEVITKMEEVRQKFPDSKAFVELLDWIPANTHVNCKAFHVYGEVIYNGDVNSKVLVHWIVYEHLQDIKNYVAASYYVVRFNNMQANRFRVNGQEKAIVKMFGWDAKEYMKVVNQELKEEASAQDQVH
jgi:hypothetical protein